METMMNWVLLRGLARESRHWGNFVERFAQGLGIDSDRIVTLDLPGFGSQQSIRPGFSISELVEELRAQWISKKGKIEGPWGGAAMSLGAMCLFEWARLFPGDFDRLVSINASVSDLSKPWDRFSLMQLPRAFRITMSKDPKVREEEIYRLTSNGVASMEKGQEWGSFAPSHAEFLKNGLTQLFAAARYKSPAAIEVPLLVLTSKADTFVNFKCSEAIAEKYRAPLKVHLNAGHDLCLDDPEWVIKQIKSWL